MTFHVLASTVRNGVYSMVHSYVHMQCADCGMPVAAEVWDGNVGSYLAPDTIRSSLQSLGQIGWKVVEIWPKPRKPSRPDHLPDAVARAYLAAERNFAQRGMEEAAAGSYGRALDIGTKLFAGDLADATLFARIKKLAETHRITADLAQWAHEIRLIRNDALHGIEEVNRDELTAIRGFTEMVLTYLFTLPGMLAARQADAAGKSDGGAAPTA